MRPTRPRLLLGVGSSVAVVVVVLLRVSYDVLPELPSGWTVSVLFIAAVEALLAWTTRSRLVGGGRLATRLEPLTVARYAALARASSPVGAGAVGAWLGVLGYLLGHRGSLPAVDHDRRVALLGVGTGLALTAAALWLEWVCRVRPPTGTPVDSDGGA